MVKMDVRKKLEQIRRSKKNTNKPNGGGGGNASKGNVKDLRQIIAKKTKKKPNAKADLRETNKKLTQRLKSTTSATTTLGRHNDSRPMTRSTKRTVNTSINNNSNPISRHSQHHQQQQQPQQQYYVPPPMRRNQPTYILAPPAVAQKSGVGSGGLGGNPADQQHGSFSVLISNLNPTITQSDIIELYGEIGSMQAVNMINQTTALVTYYNSSDAFRAVKVYHNRLLDGRPMLVNMMPTSV